jgi:hypothetical protein
MIEISPDFISATIAYVRNIFSDLKLLLFVMFGLFIGFFIIERIVEIVFHRKIESEEEEEDIFEE